ncbi:MAG TPA: hypothetical protein VHZ55_24405 [Bryobacteraceae bacterium]|jgi:glucan phosphoethanolaminetransferase (alkaline phosphatase superfamily)|nr:hypothetical protein [Bryobacteraceae bacterium]
MAQDQKLSRLKQLVTWQKLVWLLIIALLILTIIVMMWAAKQPPIYNDFGPRFPKS